MLTPFRPCGSSPRACSDIHLTAGAACVEDARKCALAANDAASAAGPGAHEATTWEDEPALTHGDAVMTDKLLAAIGDFNGQRAAARQTMWYSLTSLLVAVVCSVLKSAAEHLDDPLTLVAAALTVGVLLVSIHVLWRTVWSFRERYRAKVLGEHGYSW